MPGRPSKITAGMLLLLLLWSCDKTRIYEKYQEIPNGVWASDQPVAFDIEVEDTTQACNLIVNVRNSEEYPYRNLYLFMTTTFPDGTFAVDTLEFLLLDEKGKPYGNCGGKLCNSPFMIDHDVKFPMAGIYRFELKQAMRTPDGTLPHIRNIGMRLERSTGNN